MANLNFVKKTSVLKEIPTTKSNSVFFTSPLQAAPQIIETIKEVPIEVIKEIPVEVIVEKIIYIDKPIEVIKEVEKLIKVDNTIEIIKEIPVEVKIIEEKLIEIVKKELIIPMWCKIAMGAELLIILGLLIKGL